MAKLSVASVCVALSVAAALACASPTAIADADERDPDGELSARLYQQFIDAFSRDSFLALSMIKDYPRDREQDLETFIEFARPMSAIDSLSASVARARRDPISWQLSELIEAGKGSTLEQLAPQLELDEVGLSEASCPALRAAFDELTEGPWTFDLAPTFPEVIEIPIHPRVFILAKAGSYGPSFQVACSQSTPQCDRLRGAYASILTCMPANFAR